MPPDPSDLSWPFIAPERVTVGAIVLAGALALAALLYVRDRRDPEHRPSDIAYIVLAFFAVVGLHGVTRGGGRVDGASRQVVRWWGPGFPMVSRAVSFDAIQAVVLSVGLRPGGRGDARPKHRWLHVAVRTDDGPLVVRLMKNRDDAEAFAKELATRVGAPFESDVA